MTLQPLLFGILVAGVIICLGFFFRLGRSRIRERLQGEYQSQTKPSRAPKENLLDFQLLPKEVADKLETKLGLKKGSSKVNELKKLMIQAGIYHEQAPSIYFGLKLGLALALPVLVMPWLFGRGFSFLGLLAIFFVSSTLGFLLPTMILNHLVEARKKKIKEGLPDALDLLVVCVEAGQGLNAALKRVSDELKLSNPVLARELGLVNLEINAGLERETALRNLAERTGVEEVASLSSMLIQADRFGTSLAQSLKVHSETLRVTRRQKLEELAAKTPVKLVFPLLLFIFPALMVVIIGPAVIRIMENLK
jgi:tight adherence protein C|uniref:Type II secretion system F family protein n=1 Tax=Desulfobacca acetoxidans TaxID=60893 RepID=A0A7C5AMM2_9BACT